MKPETKDSLRFFATLAAALIFISGFVGFCIYASNHRQTPLPPDRWGIEFPLDKGMTLSWWYDYDDTYLGDFTDLSQHPFMKEMEERTNVRIKFSRPTSHASAESELMITVASGSMCDMVTQDGYGLQPDPTKETYINDLAEDEIYLPLDDYISMQMPNFCKLRYKYAVIDKMITTANKDIMFIPMLTHIEDYKAPRQTEGLIVRQDILDRLGLPLPVTLSDWETVLSAFLEAGVSAPLAVGTLNDAFEMPNGVFLTAFDARTGCYYDAKTGDLAFGASKDAFWDFVTLLRKWYEKGYIALVDPTDEEKLGENSVGAWYGSADEIDRLTAAANNGAVFAGVSDPVKNRGDKITLRNKTSPCGSAFFDQVYISYDCDHPALVCAWLDKLFSDESYMRASYGIEGEDYTVGDDGSVTFTEKIAPNTEKAAYRISQTAFLQSVWRDPYVLIDRAYCEKTREAVANWSLATDENGVYDDGTLYAVYTKDETSALEDIKKQAAVKPTDRLFIREIINGMRPLEDRDIFEERLKGIDVDGYVSLIKSIHDRLSGI